MTHWRKVALVVLVAAACQLGPRSANFRPARGPEGVVGELRIVSGRVVRGEVLVVEDSALLVREGAAILRMRLPVIHWGRFRQVGAATIERGRFLYGGGAEALRLVSRFPQGLPPERLGALLAAYGRAEVEVVEP